LIDFLRKAAQIEEIVLALQALRWQQFWRLGQILTVCLADKTRLVASKP
jgi:hypothetical protein